MATKRYELNDEQWDQIKDMFPKAKTGRPPKDNRLMFNAILWLARSGAAWADIPERYGPHQTVYSIPHPKRAHNNKVGGICLKRCFSCPRP